MPRGKCLQYPQDGRVGGHESRSERCDKGKKSHHLPCREMDPGRPARSLVTILIELPGFHIYDILEQNKTLKKWHLPRIKTTELRYI